VSRLDDARAALLASGLRLPNGLVHDAISRDLGAEPPDHAWAEIKLECPDGHFVAKVTVLATSTWPGVTLLPELEPESVAAERGLAYEELRTWMSGDPVELSFSRVRAACGAASPRGRCAYRGSLSESALATKLAEAAARGHARYRLED
jgi:hypothetical protein